MAYAAVTSLLETLEQILHPPYLILQIQGQQIESLHRKFTFFGDFLLSSADKFTGDEMVQHLETAIQDMACRVEDYVEEILLNLSIWIEELETKDRFSGIHGEAQKMFTEIDFIEAEVLKHYGEAYGIILLQEENYPVEGLSLQAPNSKNALVFLEESFLIILEKLTGLPSKLQILAVVGMRNVGKTVLAKRIFGHPFVLHHFYIRAWVTVAAGSTVRELLLGLLQCVARITDEIYEKSNGQLSEHLFRSLKGHRYLIVIDNMLSTEVWNDVKRSLPDDKNGSRILLTSRRMNLAIDVNDNSPPCHMHFPYVEESWRRFYEVAFSEDHKPLELVKIGNQIAEDCQGLLLAIVLAAGILSKLSETPNYRRDAVKRSGSFTRKFFEQCMDILTLNYNLLPCQLRACFFYIGALPDDYEIFVYVIIRVWIFVGLLRLERLKSLDEVAKACLEDLVKESLIVDELKRSDHRVKTNLVHDLFWNLYCQDSQREKFLDLIRKSFRFVSKYMDDYRHLGFNSEIHLHVWLRPLFPLTRSLLWFGMKECLQPGSLYDGGLTSCIWLLVLDIVGIPSFNHFPVEVTQLVLLQYLALSTHATQVPSSISELHHLETLIVDNHWKDTVLPWEIWTLSRLRHIRVHAIGYVPDAEIHGSHRLILKNLRTLSTLSSRICRNMLFGSTPNLQKLILWEPENGCRGSEKSVDYSKNLNNLQRLMVLKWLGGPKFIQASDFPPWLIKLTLIGSSLSWEDINALGKLPNLEVLKLKSRAALGPEWEPVQGGFRKLLFLLLEKTNLVNWKVTSHDCFPSLEYLVVRSCYDLGGIPLCIGEIPTLQKIVLEDCSQSAVRSANQILRESSHGNMDLRIHIY